MKKLTFTKIFVLIYSILFSIWITLSYVLAFFGHDEIAEDLSAQVVNVGIATILGYMLKAFFETREEERIRLERNKLNIDSSIEEVEENNDEESVE